MFSAMEQPMKPMEGAAEVVVMAPVASMEVRVVRRIVMTGCYGNSYMFEGFLAWGVFVFIVVFHLVLLCVVEIPRSDNDLRWCSPTSNQSKLVNPNSSID
jgi:hypothetical protein